MGDIDQDDNRRRKLQIARDSVDILPCQEAYELAGRPNVSYELRDYAQPNKVDGAKQARSDIPYLFKSFETGQARPPRPGTKNAQLPRAATIHEYLDWTVTAQGAAAQDELVTNLLPRLQSFVHVVKLTFIECWLLAHRTSVASEPL